MNRQIKFRVWDSVDKIWVHEKGFNQIAFDRNGLFFPYGTGKSNMEWPNRFFFQQYSGLEDKNGKEIYEGDILKFIEPVYKPKTSNTSDFELFGVVSNDGTDFQIERWVEYYTTPRYDVFLLSQELYNKTCEVVGNIFENPDLVK